MSTTTLRDQRLLRHHIGKRLGAYYAQSSDKVVGTLAAGEINFSWLLGEAHYRHVYRQRYRTQKGQWMTPVELFRPYYSHCFADFMAKDVMMSTTRSDSGTSTSQGNNDDSDRPIRIVELGAGRGTNAQCILSRWKDKYPDLYHRLQSYTLVDSSPSLHKLQKRTLQLQDDNRADGHGTHGERVDFRLVDLMAVAEGESSLLETIDIDCDGDDEADTYVLAFEVLDNLPHDKIRRCPTNADSVLQAQLGLALSSSESSLDDTVDFELLSNVLNASPTDFNSSLLEEVFSPVDDVLIEHILDTIAIPAQNRMKGQGQGQRQARYIPSVACGVIRHVLQHLPRSRLILADFDWLPPAQLIHSMLDDDDDGSEVGSNMNVALDTAVGAPLITSMEDKDYGSLLDSPYLSDILFPTDFAFLASYIRGLSLSAQAQSSTNHNVKVNVSSQGDFLQTHGAEHVKATQSSFTGFSPLTHDFSNCSVMTVTRSF
jgi:hypothetical protein